MNKQVWVDEFGRGLLKSVIGNIATVWFASRRVCADGKRRNTMQFPLYMIEAYPSK